MLDKEILIFDFDGVICDSVNIKTQAFIELYKNYGSKIQEQVREYHLINSGISRFINLNTSNQFCLNMNLYKYI